MMNENTASPAIRLDAEESRIWHTARSEQLWLDARRLALQIMDETGKSRVTIRAADGSLKRTVTRADCLVWRDSEYVAP